MTLVENQLNDQEEFILGIKLNLATLNKAYAEKDHAFKLAMAQISNLESQN